MDDFANKKQRELGKIRSRKQLSGFGEVFVSVNTVAEKILITLPR